MVRRRPRELSSVYGLLALRTLPAHPAGSASARLEISVPRLAPGALRPPGPRAVRRTTDPAGAAQSDVMKILALVPVRNDAWILEHSLGCWSGCCHAIIVSDQDSTDGSREIYRRFPKVVVLENPRTTVVTGLPQQARWRLLDAARQYDGNNLLWCTDADELTPPTFARAFFDRHRSELTPRRVIECRFYNLWHSEKSYREDLSLYGPHWKPMGFVDDRRVDYPRDPARRP